MTLNCGNRCNQGWWGTLGNIPWYFPPLGMTSYGKAGVYEANLVYCSVCNNQFKDNGDACQCCGARLRRVGIYKRRKERKK